jgi:hypothetical protein
LSPKARRSLLSVSTNARDAGVSASTKVGGIGPGDAQRGCDGRRGDVCEQRLNLLNGASLRQRRFTARRPPNLSGVLRESPLCRFQGQHLMRGSLSGRPARCSPRCTRKGYRRSSTATSKAL